MTVTITGAGLAGVYPEWAEALVDSPLVIGHAVDLANAKSFDLYTDPTEELNRRYLEASAWLYERAFSRDMSKPSDGSMNPYRRDAEAQDKLKGGAYRGPGLSLPSGVT